jgi:hypothetical protein
LYGKAPGPTLEVGDGPLGEDLMVAYVQQMMRKEPITFGVMILMIAILIFGMWDILHTVKR